MLNHDLIKKLDMKAPSVWLATWGGCGLVKKGPGTVGTVGGLPFGMILLFYGGPVLLLGAALVLFSLGYFAARKFEDMSGEHDSGAIVVDEVVGIWITLAAVPLTVAGIVGAFVLFRFYDILKPWPVSRFDKMPGAMGVMADDVAAGVLAALLLLGVRYVGLI